MEEVAEFLGIQQATVERAIFSLVLILALALIRVLILRWVRSQVEETEIHYRAHKITNYTLTAIGIISLLFIWIDAFGSLTTYLGLVSAGIAIALGDLLKNMAAWGYIIGRHPFRVGDRIEVRGTRGDVLDIRLFRFTVMEVGNWVDADQSTGRLIHIPNGIVFTDTVANYTEGFRHIWDEIPVTVTFESDWEMAKRTIREVIDERVPDVESAAGARIRRTAQEYQIRIGYLTPTVYLRVVDHGVRLTGRYLVEARQRRTIQEKVWEGILERFNATPAVSFAYPTIRTYFEGPISVSGPQFE